MSDPEPLRAEFRFPVEAGHIMQFARAVGDPNPVYSDPDRAAATELGHMIAPPTFTMAAAHFDPDWPLRLKEGEPWRGSGRTPSGTADLEADAPSPNEVRLHAEQHFEYHRHPRPDDVLTVTEYAGRTWVKDGRRGGRMHFAETVTQFRDQDGEPVITARRVGVRIERQPAGA